MGRRAGARGAVAGPAVVLVPYSPEWPGAFAGVERRLQTALAPLAHRLDHIGSTSVPGLLSKDRIDVQLGIASLSIDIGEPLLRAGFALGDGPARDHVPPGPAGDMAGWEKRFATGLAGARPVNLHVRRLGAANWRYALLFRDFLRSDPIAAAAYGRAKTHLASLCPTSPVYAEAKDPVCDLVIVAAEAWAGRTGWAPTPRTEG